MASLPKIDFPIAVVNRSRNLIFGSGEMADLTRAFDWSRTSVGPVERWPEPLLTTVNILLCSQHPMLLMWGDDLIQFYNDGYRSALGADKHPALLGAKGRESWPEAWPIVGPEFEAVMADGKAFWHENNLVPINRNGKLEDVYWTYGYSPVRDFTGRVRGALVVCNDTTQSVLSQQHLAQERERLAALFEQAPVFFAALGGPQHTFEMINARYQELIGQRTVVGKTVREAIPEVVEQGFVALLDQVYRTGEPFIGRGSSFQVARDPSKSLEQRYVDFIYQPRHEADGTISGIIVVGNDVTARKQSEQALIQSEKLAAVGRLASSIAHEINNPLEAVTNLLYLARQEAVDPECRQHITEADVQLRRVAVIANQTLRFRRQTSDRSPVVLNDLVDDVLSLFQGRLVNSRIHVERRNRGMRTVNCSSGEIRQVLSNLIGNAIDAMSATGGRLLISSRESANWNTGQKGVVLTLADTGPGISPSILARIFEPFFTTKGSGGTGLGLWISHEIVKRHQGSLRVRSCQSPRHSGTVFTLFLPYAQSTAQ